MRENDAVTDLAEERAENVRLAAALNAQREELRTLTTVTMPAAVEAASRNAREKGELAMRHRAAEDVKDFLTHNHGFAAEGIPSEAAGRIASLPLSVEIEARSLEPVVSKPPLPAWFREGQRVRGISAATKGLEGTLHDVGYAWVIEGGHWQIGKAVLDGIENEWEPVDDEKSRREDVRAAMTDAFVRGAGAMKAAALTALYAMPAGTWGDERGECSPWPEAIEAVRKLPLPKDEGAA
jgi:hypothetical protein